MIGSAVEAAWADSVVIASVAAADLAAAGLAVLADLVGAAVFAAVAAGSEAGDEINAWSVQSYFL